MPKGERERERDSQPQPQPQPQREGEGEGEERERERESHGHSHSHSPTPIGEEERSLSTYIGEGPLGKDWGRGHLFPWGWESLPFCLYWGGDWGGRSPSPSFPSAWGGGALASHGNLSVIFIPMFIRLHNNSNTILR